MKNNGFHNPEFPGRMAVAYGPTGTYRDAITARDRLHELTKNEDMMMAIIRSFMIGAEMDPGRDTEEWLAWFEMAMQDATAPNVAPLWIAADVARQIEHTSNSVLEPSSSSRWKLPPHGLALTQSPIFDRIMGEDGAEPYLNTQGLALTGILWSRRPLRDGEHDTLMIAPLASAKAFTSTNQTHIEGELIPAMPIGCFGHAGGRPFNYVSTRPGFNIRRIRDWSHSSIHWARFYTALENWCQALYEDTETRPVRDYERGGAKKRGRKQPPKLGDVRVVKLRRKITPDAAADDVSGTGSGRSYSVRWVVGGDTGGFWRRYHVGKGRTEEVDRWILPYVAGPEDAPLDDRETIFKVDR